MKAECFNVDVPEGFELSREGRTFVRMDKPNEPFEVQAPYFSIDLRRQEDIETQKGESFLEKYVLWSEGFKSEVVSTEEFAGTTGKTFLVKARTNTVLGAQEYKFEYYNACILLTDGWCLDYQFVYETASEGVFSSVAQNLFDSIEIINSPSDWVRSRIADEEQTQAEFVAESEPTEDEYFVAEFSPPAEGSKVDFSSLEIELLADKSKWEIAHRELMLSVFLKAKDKKMAVKAGLITKWADDGEVSIHLSLKNIFKSGTPIGEVLFKDGKADNNSVPRDISLRFRDFEYGLEFEGSVFLKESWVGIDGYLRKSYSDTSFRVEVYHKFDLASLDWSEYLFCKEELGEAPLNLVRYINYFDEKLTEFPSEIFNFTALQELTLRGGATEWKSYKYVSSRAPMSTLPKEFGKFSQLKKLSLSNFELELLPRSIGELKNLEYLFLHACRLKSLPEELFTLPKLKHISITKCELDSLPELMSLPSLHRVDLSNNQLSTLPESLALQPSLKNLKLTGNALTYLPDAYNQVAKIDLEHDDKKRLLDFSYKGAGEQGVVEWDDSIYFASNDPKVMKPVKSVLKRIKSKDVEAAFCSIVKKTVGFKIEKKDNYKNLGEHRFGGYPDLPESISYPVFGDEAFSYEFIAQLNLAQIAPLQDYLPKEGLLYFFLTTFHDIGHKVCPTKVIWYNGEESLISGKSLSKKESNFYDSDEPYEPYKVKSFVKGSLPCFYSAGQNPHWFNSDKTKMLLDPIEEESFDLDLYTDIEDPISKISPDDFSINPYVFTQHESPELSAALALKGNPEDWVTLLKVSSSGSFQWCDAGELFFVIHKSDLAKRDFSQVYATLESS